MADAERYYKEILPIDPDHSDALYLPGVIASQVGKNALAARMIARAIEISRNHPMYYNNLGHVFKNLDNPDLAISGFEAALALDSGLTDALRQLVHHLQKICDQTKLDALWAQLDDSTYYGSLDKRLKPAESPYINVTRHDDPSLNF